MAAALSASTSISSSLAAQNELLSEIARLRHQLSQAESQVTKAREQGFRTSLPRRRAPSSNASSSSASGVLPGLAINVQSANSLHGSATAARPRQRTTSAPQSPETTGFMPAVPEAGNIPTRVELSRHSGHARTRSSDSAKLGLAGRPSSSLAASPTKYSLKRDEAYEDLHGVAAHSPTLPPGHGELVNPNTSVSMRTKQSAMQKQPSDETLRRSGGNSTKIPIPAIPKGRVASAATLADGSSPTSKSRDNPQTSHITLNGQLSPTRQNGLPTIHSERSLLVGSAHDDAALQVPSLRSPVLSQGSSSRAASPAARVSRAADCDEDTAEHPKSTGHRASSSPFFGGSAGFTERHAARIASSQSNTSKVIMNLQGELTNVRAQLESTRAQLRSSARGVESLTRQNEDAKEVRERLRLEMQSAGTTLSRKERMLEETLTRARAAESSLRMFEEEKKIHYAECTKRLKDLEGRVKEAEERRGKAESEYAALRSSSASLTDGFKKELKQLRKDQTRLRLDAEKVRNEVRSRQAAAAKALADRQTAVEEVKSAPDDMRRWQTAMQEQYQNQLSSLSKQYQAEQAKTAALEGRVQEILEELSRFRSAVQRFDITSARPL